MANTSGRAYALTTLCPIKKQTAEGNSANFALRYVLQNNLGATAPGTGSPMALVPNTYLARFFVLDDARFQGYPYQSDTLNSSYLVFVVDFHGDLDSYLKGMYHHMKTEIFEIWKYCYGFENVVKGEEIGSGEAAFVQFIRKCQVETTFYFDGSTDDPLDEQLKALYLKQELSDFVFSHQGADANQLLTDFKTFIQDKKPGDLKSPTWKAGN